MASALQLPGGEVTVRVAFLCNALLSGIPMSRFAKPSIRGLETLDRVPCFSFLIEHPSGQRILFDLGVRKDWNSLSPLIAKRIFEGGWRAEVEQDIPTILEDNGVPLKSINTVIWSHWHWDHVGDMSRLPSSVSLVTGPGLKMALLSGFPTNREGLLLESDYSGRTVHEITDFKSNISGIPAHDFFGDGSFYLLSTPGHAIGHLSAIARTTSHTSEDGETFIVLGGDCCHHLGQLRPSEQQPLPEDVRYTTSQHILTQQEDAAEWHSTYHSRGTCTPFMDISDYPDGASAAVNPIDATHSLQKLRALDNADNVFFTIAHDTTLLGIVELFPLSANDWKRKGWAKQARWKFLQDFKDSSSALGLA